MPKEKLQKKGHLAGALLSAESAAKNFRAGGVRGICITQMRERGAVILDGS